MKKENMKNRTILTLFLCLVVGMQSVLAQGSLEEGFIRYIPTKVETNDLRLQTMVNGSTFDVYFNPNRQKVDVKMMSESVRFQFLTDTYMGTATMLTEGLVGKIMVKTNQKESQNELDVPEYTITYNKKIRKKIAGYDCYQAILDFGQNQIKAFITDKISPNVDYLEDIVKEMAGFPMEIEIEFDGTAITMTAEKVSKSFDSKVFRPSTEGYKEMKAEEIENMMKGL